MNKERQIIIFIFVFALICRIFFLFLTNDTFLYTLLPDSDCNYYHNWAQTIAKGNFIGSSVFYGMPLYPYFLGLIYRILGSNQPAFVRIIQLLMGAFNAIFVYFIAKKVFNQKIALLSSLLVCAYFMLIFYEILLMPVTLIIFLNSILIFYILKIKDNINRTRMCLLGLLLGIVALAEAGVLLFLAMIIVWLFLNLKQKANEKSVYILILIISVFLIISLATLRNYLVEKDFVSITAHSGINFFIGNNPEATGSLALTGYLHPTQRGILDDARIYAERQSNRKLKPSEISSFWFSKASVFIKDHPIDYLKLLFKKIKIYWHNFEPMDSMELQFLMDKKITFFLLTNSFGIISSLGLVGIILALIRLKSSSVDLLILFILSQFFSSVMFFVTSRNRLVIVPFLVIFASYFIFWIFETINYKRTKSLFMGISSFIVVFLSLNLFNPGYDFLELERSYNLGVLHTINKSFDEAQKQLSKAIDLNPTDYTSYFALANVYLIKGYNNEAVQLYEKAISLNPNFIDAYFNLGYAYQQKGELEKAENFYKFITELDVRAYDAHYNLGNIYKAKGDCEKAVFHYNKIPTDGTAYYSQVYPKVKECQK